jgi:hypothetical protein
MLSAMLCLGGAARAQLSPGPLSRAHASLEGAQECFRCHGGGRGAEAMTPRCLECHGEIARRLDRGTGLHGREGLDDCSRCHPDHAGRDFELIDWGRGGADAFDHDRTGWPLSGRHARVECRRCHRAELQTADLDGAPKRARAGESWLGLTSRCATCHEDVHRGTLGDGCATCHTAEGWKPARAFDHARTDYPLEGRHREVECLACHLVPGRVELRKANGEAAPRFKPVAHAECSDCHEDVHRGRLGPLCASCHVVAGFDQVDDAAFDHGRTRFPLVGRHAAVKCAECHEHDAPREPLAFDRCVACHDDPHDGRATLAGREVGCAACHDERGFRPSTYGVEEHRASAYPLLGKHASVKCADCHTSTVVGASAGRGDKLVELRPAHDACGDCHLDAHAGQLRGRPGGGACESCHRVDGWAPSTFDAARHAALRFTLAGRHAKAECSSCHSARRTDLAPLPAGVTLGSAAVLLVGVETECAACHYDPHEGMPAKGCRDCHDLDGFRPSTVDVAMHDRFRYPLEGAHRATPCALCHEELTRPPAVIHLLHVEGEAKPLRFSATHDRCEPCHADPHGGQFAARGEGGRCSACHTPERFTPATGFDHDRDAAFALAGAHRNVPCASCHRAPAGSADAVVRYRPLTRRCRDCHGGAAKDI